MSLFFIFFDTFWLVETSEKDEKQRFLILWKWTKNDNWTFVAPKPYKNTTESSMDKSIW